MIPIKLRAKILEAGARVDKRSLQEIPIFTFLDFFRFRLMGWKNSVWLMADIHQYRYSLGEPEWKCLTVFYPRPTYMLYYYLLFWWADYTGVHDILVEKPEKSLVAELFIRYIIEIDAVIDDPMQADKLNEPEKLKRAPAVSMILNQLLSHVQALDIPHRNKRSLCRYIWHYREDSLSICQNALRRKTNTFSSVFNDKDQTAGVLFQTWAKILCLLYLNEVSSEPARSSQEILQKTGMAIQVVDDMMDLPKDHAANVSNLFFELLKETPLELLKAEELLGWIQWQHLDVTWARGNLPVTCAKAARLMDNILEQIKNASINPGRSGELIQMMSLFSRLGFGPLKSSALHFDKASVH